MKPYTLKITNISQINEKKYAAEISLVDADRYTDMPYKIIEVEAINKEFAERIFNIRLEEMMVDKAALDIVHNYNCLKATKECFVKNYNELITKLNAIENQMELLLIEIVKKMQTSKDGIDIKALNIYVNIDDEKMLVYAIRVDEDMMELKATNTGDEFDLEWYTVYDFTPDTSFEILTAIMEKL